MSFEGVLDFVRENPVCTIATMDGEQPRARAFLTVLFDDGKLYFTTASTKKVYGQIRVNPKVELCYCTPDFRRMLRVTGSIEVVDDRARKQKLLDERDYLKTIKEGKGADDPRFILLRLSHGTARFWSIEYNMREDELEAIEF
jgi:uncharacterized pyridoxamine 5'-phosphate oxidase family protein